MSHGANGIKFTATDFGTLAANPLANYTHIFQYFSDGIDSLQSSLSADTGRAIQVNGTQVLNNTTSSGVLNFSNNNSHNVVFSYNNNAIMANVSLPTDTNYYPTAMSWTNGATSGPTATITMSGTDNISVGSIPSASSNVSGVVTTDAQTFGGNKTFYGSNIAFVGHISIYGDNDEDDSQKPSHPGSSGQSDDLDVRIFNTGVYVFNNESDDQAKISGPTGSGTFATQEGVGSQGYVTVNYYPTAMSGTTGTVAGPTATISMSGTNNISVDAVPSASKTQSGVITVGTQAFAGEKSLYGDLILRTESGSSPRLTFQRGTLSDTFNDGSIFDSGGYLYFQQRGNGSTAWETRATITTTGADFVGTLKQGGKAVATQEGVTGRGYITDAIEDVTALPTGSAIDENIFYRLTTIGEEIVVPIPGDEITAFSNVVFNTDLSVSEVTSIVTNTNIAYTDISADQSPIGMAFKMYDINYGDYQKKYQYTLIGLPSLDFLLICNQTMLESMSSGTQTGDEQIIGTNNGSVLAQFLGVGVSLPDGGDPLGTGILMDPITPIYFLNNNVETHPSNGLLKELIYCTQMTAVLKIKEIYEDNVADTTHTQYIKSNLGTLKLNVVDTMPTTVGNALSLVYIGVANYTIGATPNNNHAIVALFVEDTDATTVTPYLLAALIDESDLDNPSINTSYAAIGPAGTVMGTFLQEAYGTITMDVEPIKNVVLYHHKDDAWYDVGSGLDPRFVVGTTAEISAMSDDELQGKVVILTDETENYKSTLEAIQEQVSAAMVNVAHISDIPQLQINGVATNRINIQTGITDGFAKSVSWTSTQGIQSGQASADSNNNIDISSLVSQIINPPDVVTAASQTLGTDTIVLGSGSQTVKSSNYTITSDASHITGSVGAATNEIPTAAAVHDAIATVNNLRASYSSGVLTLIVE